MRRLLQVLLAAAAAVLLVNAGRAQTPERQLELLPAAPAPAAVELPAPRPIPITSGSQRPQAEESAPVISWAPAAVPGKVLPASAPPSAEELQVVTRKNVELLEAQLQTAQGAAQTDQNLEKKVELLQKQVQIQQKMIKLLLDKMERPATGPAVEKLQTQVSTLEARSKQAAQRDQDVQQAIDNLTEHLDSDERNGPRLPATLKELFLPSRTNETPLSIYGQVLENFTQMSGRPGSFSSPDFAPYFLLQLNNEFLLAASVDISNAGGVSMGEAQVDWIVNDWLTVVVGRYLDQIGYFNERLNHEWINRLPDVPLMFLQVSPLSSTNGIMLRGATYLGCSPVKMEYSLYGGNGLQSNFAPGGGPATLNSVADLAQITGGSDEFDARALGGRLGVVVPEWGFSAGVSTYFNGRYVSADNGGAPDQFNLWGLDLNYRHGNWDARFEFAHMYQQAASYIGNNIQRSGFYAQLAYRNLDSDNYILQRLEVALRYSRVWFKGIDPNAIDPTAFDSLVSVPVDRDQYTIGLNYYFYPSMALRVAYEFNHELNGIKYHDNMFLAQYVWGF